MFWLIISLSLSEDEYFLSAFLVQVFAQLAAESLILPPYTWPSYSNLGFAIIGHVIGTSPIECMYRVYWSRSVVFF
jgi:hypothetical protein